MKILLIMRGLPGSGKTTKAKQFEEISKAFGLTVSICSADDFRMVEGVYQFVDSPAPHYKCQEKCKQEMEAGKDIIIVDNTNCTNRSMKPYVLLAKEFGYTVEFFSIQPIDIDTLIARGIHAVPRDSYERMKRRWVANPSVEEILKDNSCKTEKVV